MFFRLQERHTGRSNELHKGINGVLLKNEKDMIRFIHLGVVYETHHTNYQQYAQGEISQLCLLYRSFTIKIYEFSDRQYNYRIV